MTPTFSPPPLSVTQIMQLVNQIIYENIYGDPAEGNSKTCKQPLASHSLREGVLLLHRGGLASFRWVKYVSVLCCVVLLQQNGYKALVAKN